MKEDEMDETCSMQEMRNPYTTSVGKVEGKKGI
jgi:hypothetical protein